MIDKKTERCCDECKHLTSRLKEWNSTDGGGGYNKVYICKLDLPYGVYEAREGKHVPHNAFRSCNHFEPVGSVDAKVKK
jgi:hypothetical protein